jgi:AcrR family transcriptional regulator
MRRKRAAGGRGSSRGRVAREPRRGRTPSDAIRRQARAAADEVQRGAIAECVCRVIESEGLEGATLRRIASELGCTTGLIAYYFPTKDDLLLHALRSALARLERAVGAAPGAPRDLRSQLAAFVAALPFDRDQRVYWRVYVAYRSAVGAHAKLSAEALRFARDAYEALREAVARELRLPVESPRVARVADALDAILDGLGAAAAFDPERYSRENVARMVDGCARGLLAGERAPSRDSSPIPASDATPVGSERRQRQ